jgi:hypothetical protein
MTLPHDRRRRCLIVLLSAGAALQAFGAPACEAEARRFQASRTACCGARESTSCCSGPCCEAAPAAPQPLSPDLRDRDPLLPRETLAWPLAVGERNPAGPTRGAFGPDGRSAVSVAFSLTALNVRLQI